MCAKGTRMHTQIRGNPLTQMLAQHLSSDLGEIPGKSRTITKIKENQGELPWGKSRGIPGISPCPSCCPCPWPGEEKPWLVCFVFSRIHLFPPDLPDLPDSPPRTHSEGVHHFANRFTPVLDLMAAALVSPDWLAQRCACVELALYPVCQLGQDAWQMLA